MLATFNSEYFLLLMGSSVLLLLLATLFAVRAYKKKRWSRFWLATAAAVLSFAGAIMVTGLVEVPAGYTGVQCSSFTGHASAQTLEPGVHLISPIGQTVALVRSSTDETLTLNSRTKDAASIALEGEVKVSYDNSFCAQAVELLGKDPVKYLSQSVEMSVHMASREVLSRYDRTQLVRDQEEIKKLLLQRVYDSLVETRRVYNLTTTNLEVEIRHLDLSAPNGVATASISVSFSQEPGNFVRRPDYYPATDSGASWWWAAF